MQKSLAFIAVLSLFAFVAVADAAPITVSFAGLTNNGFANGEVTGNEFLGQGLDLNLVTGIAFNVGCGGVSRCLGADLAATNDFTGIIEGLFVDSSLNAATVTRLDIDFASPSNGTVTTLFAADGTLVGAFTGTDVIYTGGPVARFRTDFGFDGMFSLTYDGLQTSAAAVPEPTSLVLLGSGALGLLAKARRRKKAAPSA